MELKLPQHMRFSEEQPVTEVVHSCQDMRVVVVNLLPGQELRPQSSSSSVSLQLIQGQGQLLCSSDWVTTGAGTIRFYPPAEPHGVRAVDEPVSVLMTIAPRP